MSGLPNPQLVARLRTVAIRQRALVLESVELDKLIARSETRRESIGREEYEARREMVDLLNKMDCASNHNNGWENRVVWMLAELSTHAPSPPAEVAGAGQVGGKGSEVGR